MEKLNKVLLTTAFTGLGVLASGQVLESDLGLTNEQQQKWDSIHQLFKDEYKKIMLDKTLTVSEKSKQMETLNARESDARKAVLTNEQRERFEKLTAIKK